jgi:hypothetical protein
VIVTAVNWEKPVRRIAALLAVGVAFAMPPAFAMPTEGGGGADNLVLAFNSTDGNEHARSGVAVSPTASDPVANENLAYAKSSSCEGCRTVAVAVQAVLITREASVIAPKNVALAVNESCTSCRTMAAAYQYVITTGGPVHLSEHGRQAIAEIRTEITAAATSGLPFPELESRLDGLVARFKGVIDNELIRVGQATPGSVGKRVSTSG